MSNRKIFDEAIVAALFARWGGEAENRDHLAGDILIACQALIDWQASKLAATTPMEFADIAQEMRIKIFKILKHYRPERGSTYSFLLNAIQNLGRTMITAHQRKCGHVFCVDGEELHDVAERRSFEEWGGSR